MHTHPKRNMLTKAVGVEKVIKPDFFRMKREDKFTRFYVLTDCQAIAATVRFLK